MSSSRRRPMSVTSAERKRVGIPERPVAVQRQLEQVLAQQDDLLGAAEHGRPVGEPRLERVLAQQPVAEGVERADPRVVVPVRHEAIDALDHLRRGAVGEGERQDLRGLRQLLGDEPGDAAGDDGRLARAGTGHDEERPGVVRDRLALAGGEVGEERRLDAEVRPARSGRCGQLLEERDLVWCGHHRRHVVDGSGGPIHPVVIGRLPDSSPVAEVSMALGTDDECAAHAEALMAGQRAEDRVGARLEGPR